MFDTAAIQLSVRARAVGIRPFVASLICAVLCTHCASAPATTTVSSALYGRTDTNATSVWAPRERVAVNFADTAGVESTFALDVWTGASIDVVTAATHAIHEVRKEVTAGAFYEFAKAGLSGGYRYSTENDYWSHGGVGSLSFDMASNNATLVLSGFGSKDIVGRAGDAGFRKPQSSAGGRLSLTQVLDTKTWLQASWETTRVAGYQASPYRYVAIGGQGTCAGSAPLCLPETVPGERTRSAAVLRGRRALGQRVSMGVDYRFYFDDWGVLSHTIAPDLVWLVTEHGSLDLSYRYYTQSEADFYRPRYVSPGPITGYVTRDRELSALYSNRLGLGFTREFPIGADTILKLALRTGVTRYVYLAFVGLQSVDALEGTLLLSLNVR
jgi:hypothetical protein